MTYPSLGRFQQLFHRDLREHVMFGFSLCKTTINRGVPMTGNEIRVKVFSNADRKYKMSRSPRHSSTVNMIFDFMESVFFGMV